MGEVDESRSPATPVSDLLQESEISESENAELNRRLGESLSDIAQQGGVTSWFADKMAGVNKWIEKEVDERKQTIGGIDNMWLLMADATGDGDCDFNPVRFIMSRANISLTLRFSGLRMHIHFAW